MNLKAWYDDLYGWMNQHGIRIIIAVIVIVLGQLIISALKRWINAHMRKRSLDTSVRPFLSSLFFVIMQVLCIFLVMKILGIRLTIFATIIGGISVAAGLALSGTLQNFTSGILILLLKPYKQGDNIVAQGQDGTITSIQLFYTVMTTTDEKTVIIPNSKLSNEVIVNAGSEGKRRLDIELKFGFAEDIDKLKTTIQQVLTSSETILTEPAQVIGVSVIEADGFRIMINTWVNIEGFQHTKSTLQEKLIQELKTAGVKLPGL